MVGPESTSEGANLYWDTAARLAVVYADERSLDVTAQEDSPRDGRVSVSLTPRAKGEVEPNIALITERLDRIGGVLGKVITVAATVTTIRLEGDTLEGAQQTWQRQYDTSGEPTAEGVAPAAKMLDSGEALSELETIAEHVLNLTAEVPQFAIDEACQALQELAIPPQDTSEPPTPPQNPSA